MVLDVVLNLVLNSISLMQFICCYIICMTELYWDLETQSLSFFASKSSRVDSRTRLRSKDIWIIVCDFTTRSLLKFPFNSFAISSFASFKVFSNWCKHYFVYSLCLLIFICKISFCSLSFIETTSSSFSKHNFCSFSFNFR